MRLYIRTVGPPNKGHFGDNMNSADLFFVERFKMYCTNCTGAVSPVLCREVYFTVSIFGRVHYGRSTV